MKKSSKSSSDCCGAVRGAAAFTEDAALICGRNEDTAVEARGGEIWDASRAEAGLGGGDKGATGRPAAARAVEAALVGGADLGLFKAGIAGTAPKLSLNGSNGSNALDPEPCRTGGRVGAADRAPIKPPKSSSGGAWGTCATEAFDREPKSPERAGGGRKSSSSWYTDADVRDAPRPPLANTSRSSGRIEPAPISALARGEVALSLPSSSGLLDGARFSRLKKRPMADGCAGSSADARPDPPISTSSTPSVYRSSSFVSTGFFGAGVGSSAGLALRPNQDDLAAAGFASPSCACATASDADWASCPAVRDAASATSLATSVDFVAVSSAPLRNLPRIDDKPPAGRDPSADDRVGLHDT